MTTRALRSYAPGSKHWARTMPAGFARYSSYGRWKVADHLLLIQAYILEMLAGSFDNLIVSMPPRHGKSEFIAKKLPAWYLGNFPHHEVIITSYEATLATGFGKAARDSMEEFGPELWGLSVDPEKRAANDWRLEGRDDQGMPVTGGLRAAGILGGLTGRGGHLIIIDDPIKNAEQAQSETYRNKVWNEYLASIYSRREPGAKQIVVMTRWNEDDLAGRLLTRQAEQGGESWVELALPALCEDPANDPLERAEGDALWPQQWSREALLQIKEVQTAYWWGALYQQHPAPAEGNIFKRAWWRFWQPPGADLPPVRVPNVDGPRPLVSLPTDVDLKATSWDLTFKRGAATSFVTGEVWQRSGSNAYLLDQDRARRNFPETVKAFKELAEKHPDATAHWVEDKANGPALKDQLQDDVPGIIPIPVQGSKEDRARQVSPYVEAGNVYLPHPAIAPWVWDYIEEHAAFPNAANDDQVDTTSQGLRKLLGKHGPSMGMTWGTGKKEPDAAAGSSSRRGRGRRTRR